MDQPNRTNTAPDEIDRNSFEPAYNQLANILRRKIAAGEFQPGERLPSEHELCTRYQVSTITARRAIKILVDQEIAVTRKGQGTFFKPLKLGNAVFDLHDLETIFSDPRTKVRITGAATISADEKIAGKLKVPVGTRVLYIRRLLSNNNRPIMFHRGYLILDPNHPTVETELEVTSLSGLFTGSGDAYLKRGDLCIEATVLDQEEALVLQAETGTPAFRIEHIFYTFNDSVVSWGWFICRGDQLRFKTSVGV